MTQLDDAALLSPAPVRPETNQFLRGFVGSAILLVAMDAAEPVFFGEGHFASLTYHPFWIVILLAAVQHGLFVGLSVVGLATMMMDWPSRPVGMDITEHYVDIAIAPAQWLIAALLIGLYRQQQIRQGRAVARENDHLRDINRTLAAEIHRLDAFVARAELAAATQSLPQSAADRPDDRLAALDRLAGADADGRAQAFVEAARACLPGSVAWLRLDKAGRLTPAAMTDDGASLPGLSAADLPLPVVGQVLPLDRTQGEATDANPALCRAVSPGDDPRGVLLAHSPDHEAGSLNPGLNALGRALEDSLRRMPEPLTAAPPSFGEPARLHA